MTKEQFISDIPLETATRAHSGTSFTPEKRGEQEREGYAEQMAADYASLAALIANQPEMQGTLEAEFARYREGYKQRRIAYLHSSSRCMSTMITGASNFPVRRQEKLNNWAHNKLNELIEYRTRALAAISKTLCPGLRPIMSGDSDAVDRLREKITEAETRQEHMKQVNAVLRKHLKRDEATGQAELVKLGCTEHEAKRIFESPDCFGGYGYASFELTNNNANIRRMKQRLEGIERNRATPETQVDGENARLEDCPAENRIRLFFPGKPDEAIRSRLKSAGFRWTPTLGCWQAYRNPSTIQTAQREAGLEQVAV